MSHCHGRVTFSRSILWLAPPMGTFALMTRVVPSSERICSVGVTLAHEASVVDCSMEKVMSVALRLRR